jgi:hypothetical protein
MAEWKREDPRATDASPSTDAVGEDGSKLLALRELKRLMLTLGAAGAVLLEAANLIEEVIASADACAIQKLQLLQGAWWRLGFRAEALGDDVLKLLPEVAVRLEADEPPSLPTRADRGEGRAF